MVYLRPILFIPLLILLVSCQMASNREAHRAQALLDEAELLMEARQLDKAKESAEMALQKLSNVKKEENPDVLDLRLLEVRAHFTIFMADNLLTIENAEIRRRSLVRFPEPQQYIGWTEHLLVAERILKEIASSEKKLTTDQEGFVHGMLGAILRLNEKTLNSADREYGRAITAYRKQLAEVKANPPKIGSNATTVAHLENQIRSLLMAQAEVKLLAEEWSEALTRLEKAMAGPDLKYFAVQFEILNNSIEEAQAQIDLAIKMRKGSREEKLVQALEAKRQKKLSKREELASYNPYRLRLTQARVEESDTVNNLIYRMICYHQLKRRSDFEKALTILETFYPDLSHELEVQLRRYS